MKRFRLFPILVLTTLALSMLMPQAFTAQAAAPTISTDFPDYPPGALVTLTGTDWAPDEVVEIYVNDTANKTWEWRGTVTASPATETDPGGRFTVSFYLPTWFVANYTVVATGPLSGTATATFTDLSIGTYDQCSNDQGVGYSSGDTGCRWINGNLQGNNSIYSEGDATVQRLWLTEFTPGTTHTVTLKYGTTKGGKHAYDYLTTWDWSENWLTLPDRCQGIAGCEAALEDTLAIPMDPNVPDSIEPLSASRLFTMRGADLISATTPAIVSGTYGGDSETVITITFTVGSGTGSMCEVKNGVTTCGVALWFGAHVALTADWQIYNGTIGAGGITGSPYHVALSAVDGAAVGQRDNQMQSDTVIPNGFITVIKDAVPNDPQDFNYTLTGGVATNLDFALDDDADPALLNSINIPLPPGTFTLTEAALPAGWTFTNLVCSDPSGNTTVSGQAATVNLASAETVTCTYTNTKSGKIIVKKVIAGAGAEADQLFTFDPSWGENFTLIGGGSHDSGPLLAGTYSVAESDPGDKWDLTSATCDDGSPVTAIDLANGETVTCTFTNTRVWNADLTVSKTAAPSFTRTYAWDIYKNVDATTASIALGGSATFNYTVGVTHDAGTDSAWALAGDITVSNPNAFPVAGVNISDAVPNGTCTVTDGTNLTVPANGSISRAYSCVFASAPAGNSNTATATWDAAIYNTPNGSASGSATYDFGAATPSIVNTSVSVTDTLGGSLGSVSYTDPSPVEFTYSKTFSGEGGKCVKYDNTATITENGKFATKQVEVCVGLDLTVTKTAAPAFARTWSWTIDKSPDASYNLFAGGSVLHPYRVDVTPSFVDSGWAVAGTITVTNPNAWEAIVADVADAVDNGGTCTVTGGEDVSVPAGESVQLAYSCTYGALPADGTNTATVTWDAAAAHTPGNSATGTATVDFDGAVITETGKDITVHDDKLEGENWTASGAAAFWEYPKEFSCPTDAALYTAGVYTYAGTNTASIDGTTLQDSSTVTVNCYLLAVAKTAAGTYVEEHGWDVAKSVTPALQSAFLGDTVSYEWTVTATETVTEKSFAVTGQITVNNPSPAPITVALSDVLSDGTAAAITAGETCAYADGQLTVPAASTATCAYSAAPTGRTANLNTVTATLGARTVSAEAAVTWTATVQHAEVTLGDEQNPAFPLTISEGGSWTYTEYYTCSADKTLYEGDQAYTFGEDNTAVIMDGTTELAGDTASMAVNCYVPTISKTANGTYDEVHDWEVFKSGAAVKRFAGQTANFGWTVRVDETTHGENYLVTGDIIVTNPNPEDVLAVVLNDVLNDGSVAAIGPCVGGTWSSPNLTVPAGGTATCAYSVTPTGDLVAFANGLPAQVTMKVDYPENGDPAYFEVVTITGAPALNGTYEGWCIDQDHTIAQNTNYTANVFSSYETLPAGLVEHPENFDLVNWIINQDYVYKPAGGTLGNYTYGDVQRAIWELIDDTPFSTSGLGSWNQTRVNQIKAAAIANGEGFEPTCGDFVAVVLQPVSGTIIQAITIAQVSFASLGVNCAASNAVTAVLNTVEFPASAQIVWTATTVNASATLDDSQNPLWPIMVSADQTFTYTDPEGYVCPSDPALYAGDGIAPVYTDTNTATITYEGGSRSITANSTVTCYAPVLSKTASAEWRKLYEWTLTKTAAPASHTGFIGDSFTSNYDVFVDQTVTDYGYKASGTINVKNPSGSPGAMTVNVADLISGGFAGTVDCDPAVEGNQTAVTVAVNATKTCTYTADLPDNTSRVNTATGTFNSIPFTATANVVFGAPIIEGYPTINVTDDMQGALGSADADKHFTYTRSFSCSTNPADYTGYADSDTYGNTATITETGANDDASVKVDCYIPEISKTAAGTYDEVHDWTVEKTVDVASQSGFAGDTLPFNWTITVTESVSEANFDAAGSITVVNHNPEDAMTVALSDVLSDGTAAIITTCTGDADLTDGLTVAAGGTAECAYTANDLVYTDHLAAPDTNKATVTLGGASFEATDPIEWSDHVIRDEAVLTDLQGQLNATITGGGTWTVEDSYTCSTDTTRYTTNFNYSETINNTATVTSEDFSQSSVSSTTLTCFVPDISKTAAGTYTERHEWDVEKSVSPVSQSAFLGDTVSYEWTVTVDEDVFEENFVATGTITVVNHNAEDAMTVTLSDVLNGTAANITACTGDADLTDGLTIAAGATSVCDYSAALIGLDALASAPTSNTATAVLNGVSYSAGDTIEWTPTILRANVALDDDQNPAFPLTISDGDTWIYSEQFTCSTDTTLYGATSHKYTFGESNTAVVKEGETTLDSSTASNTVDCYVPTISKDANGTYDEVHDWEVFKSVNTTSQTAFAGEKRNFTWTVRVDETTHGESYLVTGDIVVVNPNPEDALTVSLNDVLNDGSVAAIGPCTGGTLVVNDLTVPAGGTATCDYLVTPTGDLAAFAAALPASVTINSANPGPDSYWLTTVSNDAELNGVYEGWCVDIDHTMNPGVNYTATVYSSYEAYPTSLIEKYYNMDLVNWLINQGFVGQSATPLAGNYTFGDVQRAIWELIEDNPTYTTSGLGSWNQARVDQLEAIARAQGVNFEPTCGDFVAVLLVPTGGQQPIAIAQVTFASLGVDCATSNAVTAVLNGVEFPASAEILWTANPVNPTATLDDDQKSDWPTTVSADTTFQYTDPQGYTCSSDPAAYTNGFYQYNESNTALLTFQNGSDTASASTAVKCYAPVVSKTAAGAYDERHEWDVEKTVDPATQNAFAGDTVSYEWTVTVTESVSEENFVASGTISVRNPRPDDGNMTVKLSDVLSDGFVPTITGCTGGTWNATNNTVAVPPNTTAVCNYTASLTYTDDANAPSNNTVTAELVAGTTHLVTTASDPVEWTANVIRASATLDDDQNPAFPLNLTDGGTWNYSESYTCSTARTDYDATSFWYKFGEDNTAIVTSGDERDRDSASTEVNCYWPQIELTKSGDELSKITDKVYYDISVFNNTPVAAGLRALSCTITDPKIGYSETVELASGAKDENLDLEFTIPQTNEDPFINEASVTCSPLASTFSVSDSATWSTNLFQPKVEILKSGPLYATSGDVITYSFTINNLSSSDSPNLMLDTLTDNVLGDLADDAPTACDELAAGASCTFTVNYTVPDVGLQAVKKTNIVTVHYHPAGFPNDITDTDDHTVTITPRGQLTDTSYCPLANNQFRLLYRLYSAPNIYLLNGSNPGQFYYNAFYFGAPGSTFTMDIEIPYPFMTQEGAGNPIQVHDGTSLTSGGCFAPNPSLSGFTIGTEAMSPASSAGNQIITPEDYSIKQIGQTTTVTVSGVVPSTGFAYVTIHLDYGLKKTQPWKSTGTFTINPVNDTLIGDMIFGNNGPTILGVQPYTFSRAVGADLVTTDPASYNEIKKFAGFLGFVSDLSEEAPVPNTKVEIYDPKGVKLTTLYTDEDGYYMFLYKHTAKAATYTIKLPNYGRTVSVLVKSNGFAAVDFDLP